MAKPGTEPRESSLHAGELFFSMSCFLLSMGNLSSLVPVHSMGSLLGVTVLSRAPLVVAFPAVLQLGFTASIVWTGGAQRGEVTGESYNSKVFSVL